MIKARTLPLEMWTVTSSKSSSCVSNSASSMSRSQRPSLSTQTKMLIQSLTQHLHLSLLINWLTPGRTQLFSSSLHFPSQGQWADVGHVVVKQLLLFHLPMVQTNSSSRILGTKIRKLLWRQQTLYSGSCFFEIKCNFEGFEHKVEMFCLQSCVSRVVRIDDHC